MQRSVAQPAKKRWGALRRRVSAWVSALILASLAGSGLLPALAVAQEAPEKSPTLDLAPHARSAVLMDVATGQILYAKEPDKELEPASITKVMTLLLTFEAIEQGRLSFNEEVIASPHAASMGGSQIFLAPGERMRVEDLIKAVAIASANDAAVALAERIAGSEPAFVAMMNQKAQALGMKHTHFANANGLPASQHYSCAADIARMSRALLEHREVLRYTSTYEDWIRKDSKKPFQLVNTNRLVHFLPGVDGLKTGFTQQAGYCLTATKAEEVFRVVAVVMGEPNPKTRNAEVAHMLQYAFAQYQQRHLYEKGQVVKTLHLPKGQPEYVPAVAGETIALLLRRGESESGYQERIAWQSVDLPLRKGTPVGTITLLSPNGRIVSSTPLLAGADAQRAPFFTLAGRTLRHLIQFGH
ncbi:MAG: D-alanyl-D-alanine carboxypeptidase [Firmicutes bacterium]|nr:D-alanyl-D-alanine carboxypeptidase [Bacillota bacterium]